MPPCHQTHHHSGVHSPGMLSGKDGFFSKLEHNGGTFCLSLFLSFGNAELMACTAPAVAKISWGSIRHRAGWGGLYPVRDGGMERQWEKLARGLLGEVGTACGAGMAGAGGCPTAHLASSRCRAGRLGLAAWPASQGKTHRSFFCSSLPLVISLLPLALHHGGGWTEGYLGLPPHPPLPRRA